MRLAFVLLFLGGGAAFPAHDHELGDAAALLYDVESGRSSELERDGKNQGVVCDPTETKPAEECNSAYKCLPTREQDEHGATIHTCGVLSTQTEDNNEPVSVESISKSIDKTQSGASPTGALHPPPAGRALPRHASAPTHRAQTARTRRRGWSSCAAACCARS